MMECKRWLMVLVGVSLLIISVSANIQQPSRIPVAQRDSQGVLTRFLEAALAALQSLPPQPPGPAQDALHYLDVSVFQTVKLTSLTTAAFKGEETAVVALNSFIGGTNATVNAMVQIATAYNQTTDNTTRATLKQNYVSLQSKLATGVETYNASFATSVINAGALANGSDMQQAVQLWDALITRCQQLPSKETLEANVAYDEQQLAKCVTETCTANWTKQLNYDESVLAEKGLCDTCAILTSSIRGILALLTVDLSYLGKETEGFELLSALYDTLMTLPIEPLSEVKLQAAQYFRNQPKVATYFNQVYWEVQGLYTFWI